MPASPEADAAPPARFATAEAIVTGLAGGALAGAAGSVLAGAAGSVLVIGLAAGAVGAANGVISGGRAIYRWREPSGPVAFALDSTWALPMTFAALGAHLVAAGQRERGGFVAELSTRRNRHVYRGGLRIRPGFVMTLGNTISGAGPNVRASVRRQQLITDHEDVHVWQARWWGPLFPVLYVGWTLTAGAAGAVVWLLRHRGQPVVKVVETYAYYLNPFEWWAYSRDDRWPPPGKVAGLGWRMPLVAPFRATRRRFGRGHPGTPASPR